MEIDFRRNVKAICSLQVGDTVRTDNFDRPLPGETDITTALDGKDHTITDIKGEPIKSGSGFLVKIDGYPDYIDAAWLIKV